MTEAQRLQIPRQVATGSTAIAGGASVDVYRAARTNTDRWSILLYSNTTPGATLSCSWALDGAAQIQAYLQKYVDATTSVRIHNGAGGSITIDWSLEALP